MSPRAGSITPSPRVGMLTPSESSRATPSSNNPPHRTSYQMQLAQGHERERAHHRESRKSIPSVPSPTASPRFPTPTPSFRRPSFVQPIHHQQQEYERRATSPPRHPSPSRPYERHERYDYPQARETYPESFHEAQYPSQVRSYEEHPPPNSQRPAGPYLRTQYTVEPTPPPSRPLRRTYTPVEAPAPQPQQPRKTSSKATVEIFNKLIQLEHDVGGLRGEILHIRDSTHDVRTSLRALPTREEMREEMREIMTSTLQETTATLATSLTESLGASLASSLSTSLATSITDSVTAALGSQVSEAVEKATRASTQSLPAITAHLVCEKTKAALASSEKAVEAAVRSSIKSIQPQTVAPPGGTIAAVLRPINEMKTAFEKSRVEESMRFVAGVTDQISTKIAQLEVSVRETAQSRANQNDATMLQDALGGVKEQIEAVNASVTTLAENASTGKEAETSLASLQTSIEDIKKGTARLGVIEQHLAGIQNESERTATSVEQQSTLFQNLGDSMRTLATNCAAIPGISEQLRSLQTTFNNRTDPQALAKIIQDLAELKSNGALLGPMSMHLEAISTGVNAVQAQNREIGGQLQRLDAIESGVQSVQGGVSVLRRMDGTLADIKTALDTRQASVPVDRDVLQRALQVRGSHARIIETPASFRVQPDEVRETALSLRATFDVTAELSQSIGGEHAQMNAGSSTARTPSASHEQRATQTPATQPSAGQTLISTDLSSSDLSSHDETEITSADQALSAESGLHLLSVVASQASSSEILAPPPSSQVPATPSGLINITSESATPSLTPDTSPSSSSVGPSTPPASATNPVDTANATPLPFPPAFSAGQSETPPGSPPPLSKVARGRQKWKGVRPTRRSTRIQARAETTTEVTEEAPQAQQPADTDTDARLSLSAWLSNRKRKPQNEPESRPKKRTTNNSLSDLFNGEGSGSGGNGGNGGEGGPGSSRIWSWWRGSSPSA